MLIDTLTLGLELVLDQRWASVADDGATLILHLVLCFMVAGDTFCGMPSRECNILFIQCLVNVFVRRHLDKCLFNLVTSSRHETIQASLLVFS